MERSTLPARPCHVGTGTGPTPVHVGTGTGPTSVHVGTRTGPLRRVGATGRSGGLCSKTQSSSTSTRRRPSAHPPLPHLHRDWARPCHICSGTGLAPAPSAPALGSPLPDLHQVFARRCQICARRPGSPVPHLRQDLRSAATNPLVVSQLRACCPSPGFVGTATTGPLCRRRRDADEELAGARARAVRPPRRFRPAATAGNRFRNAAQRTTPKARCAQLGGSRSVEGYSTGSKRVVKEYSSSRSLVSRCAQSRPYHTIERGFFLG